MNIILQSAMVLYFTAARPDARQSSIHGQSGLTNKLESPVRGFQQFFPDEFNAFVDPGSTVYHPFGIGNGPVIRSWRDLYISYHQPRVAGRSP